MTILDHRRARAMQGDVNCQGKLDNWGKTGKKDTSGAVHRYIAEHGLPNLPPIVEENTDHEIDEFSPPPVESPAPAGGSSYEERVKAVFAYKRRKENE